MSMPGEGDHTSKIFDNWYIYPCIVPYGATLSDEEVAMYGIRGTGVPEIDERLQFQPTKVWLTINGIIEVYREYHPISFTDQKTPFKIYQDIVEYLELWKAFIRSFSLNSAYAPIEDLQLMDEFAERLRPEAKVGAVVHQRETSGRRMGSVLGDITRPLDEAMVLDDLGDHNTEIADLFKDYANRVRR